MDSVPEQFPTQDSFESQSIPAEPQTPPQPALARRIFIGPFGLRAGWSLLIYFAILASLFFSARAIHHYNKTRAHQAAVAAARAAGKSAPAAESAKTDPIAPMNVADAIQEEGITFAIVLVVSLIMALIERRRFTAYGLGGQRSVGRFLVGAVWGVAAVSLLVGTLRVLHLVSFDAQLDRGWQIFRWGGLQLLGFLFVGLVEEYMFRGYLQFTLTRGLVGLANLISRPHARSIAFWMATIVTSGLFFLAHTGNNGEDKVGLLLVFLAGVTFVVALWRTGSLWWAIGFHMAWDWSQSFLYGVPDSGLIVQGRLFATHALGNPLLSGGTDGPEGSVFCIPILLLVIVVLSFTRPSPQPALETKEQFTEAPMEAAAAI
ncbi:MAG: CPBP family intramembrane glutamic endopeptidase [Terracidiphilus sp.]|jgi:membrane protease YdiL (CAAX protease family)